MNYPRKNLIYLKQVKIRKSEIFTTFEKMHRSFLNKLKSEETKKSDKSDTANSYFYNYKLSSRILRQHRVLRSLRKNKDILITSPDKRSGVVIFDLRLYNDAIEEIISDTTKFEKLNEDPTLKGEASLQRFLRKLKQNNFFSETEYDKLYLLVLLLLVPMMYLLLILLKFSNSQFANSPQVIHFLNVIRLFHL